MREFHKIKDEVLYLMKLNRHNYLIFSLCSIKPCNDIDLSIPQVNKQICLLLPLPYLSSNLSISSEYNSTDPRLARFTKVQDPSKRSVKHLHAFGHLDSYLRARKKEQEKETKKEVFFLSTAHHQNVIWWAAHSKLD